MKKLIDWTWCILQNLAGVIWLKISKAKKADGYYVMDDKYGGSVSLGSYVFLAESHVGMEDMLKHEKGHTVQSYILGPLYLFVIGIPSFIWAWCFKDYREKYGFSYYSFYTEKWADKLAGIKRD